MQLLALDKIENGTFAKTTVSLVMFSIIQTSLTLDILSNWGFNWTCAEDMIFVQNKILSGYH